MIVLLMRLLSIINSQLHPEEGFIVYKKDEIPKAGDETGGNKVNNNDGIGMNCFLMST